RPRQSPQGGGDEQRPEEDHGPVDHSHRFLLRHDAQEDRREQQHHPAIEKAQLADGVLLAEPAPQPQAEAGRGGDPRGDDGELDDVQAHAASAFGRSFLRYMASIRRVTMKPPKMLTLASVTAATPAPLAIQPSPEVSAAAAISPPT